MYIPPHSSPGVVPFPWVRTGTAAAAYSYVRAVLFFFFDELRESIIIIMLISGHVGGLVLFFVFCIYTEEKPERKVKNTPTTPTAAELASSYYGRYRALLTFLELLLWASVEATTATDRYSNGRASQVSLLPVAAAL